MTSILRGTFLAALISSTIPALAQTGGCPALPKAMNAQEAFQMEQSSDHPGCWLRNKNTGKLEFVGTGPDIYKPLAARSPVAAPPLSGQSTADLSGSWSVKVTSAWVPNRPYFGKITVDPLTKTISWTCDSETSFSLETLGPGPQVPCDNSRVLVSGLPLTGVPVTGLVGTGNTLPQNPVTANETFGPFALNYFSTDPSGQETLTGDFVVEGDTLRGRIVSKYSNDRSIADSVSISGQRLDPSGVKNPLSELAQPANSLAPSQPGPAPSLNGTSSRTAGPRVVDCDAQHQTCSNACPIKTIVLAGKTYSQPNISCNNTCDVAYKNCRTGGAR